MAMKWPRYSLRGPSRAVLTHPRRVLEPHGHDPSTMLRAGVAVLQSFRPMKSGSRTSFTRWQLRSRGTLCHGVAARIVRALKEELATVHFLQDKAKVSLTLLRRGVPAPIFRAKRPPDGARLRPEAQPEGTPLDSGFTAGRKCKELLAGYLS